MGNGKRKTFELDRDATIICHVSGDGRRLLIEFDVDKTGLTKTGVNGLIDALKEIREKMKR
ncbi:MAG TPA: hypothetical protein VJ376_11175 [Pseudomonadota bacterium]|nr:hypothetical protein [Pseudomonadota bacterium]